MSDLATLSKESVKGLGAGAYLVNVLPSAVLVLSFVALVEARVLPWSRPLVYKGQSFAPGAPSVVETVREDGVAGGVVLLLGVIVVAVLLRPFQIRIVQLWEGYWRQGGLFKALAVERHARRASAISLRAELPDVPFPDNAKFENVAVYARQRYRAERIKDRAWKDKGSYPRRVEWILPTRFGNVLRCAETIAGERYGLKTVEVYARLYPHLSSRLDAQIREQLNVIDVMATFVLVFGVETLLYAPLLWRVDWWSIIPVLFAGFGGLSYRGATTAAKHYGQLLITAFDLHRFDMLTAMHLPLPENGDREYESNKRLVELLTADQELSPQNRRLFIYDHQPRNAESSAATGDATQPDGGATGTGSTGSA